MAILVTGGAGYIGSHTVVTLIEKGYDVVILDDLSNSKIEVISRITQITGIKPKFYQVNLLDKERLHEVFTMEKIDAVIHFAGFKAVGESVLEPLKYFENNLGSTINLLNVMKEFGVKRFIFSSSATVYGKPDIVPIKEDSRVGDVSNPYGRTKYFIEEILKDYQKANPDFSVCLLRYFNPIGAHKSGLLGEEPKGIPNNLLPYINQVAIGKLDYLRVFGNDYQTPDGTGVRDYIHVLDLAMGHVYALKKLLGNPGILIYNLGTGHGYSVLDIIKTFERVNNVNIPYRIVERRPGDIDECFADCTKAQKELGFKAKYNLADMCRDSWNFQKNNPHGIGK
ncbi:MAG: UDP-glucose 4-epimerase GalE [Candidatus Izemoplasmatales bacterium]|nr:UDP-glucose 4-epimerase GalE [Candidatus Izemoplasmatales bacterium]